MRKFLRLSSNLFKLLFLPLYDGFQLLHGYVQLAVGHHRLIYTNCAGNLPKRESYTRAAVVAIYPSADVIPFLRNLLSALAAKDFFVLVVSTRRLDAELRATILPLCHQMIERYPMGRDFGSYRIGLQWIEQQETLKNIDTLVLANDSLFYPKAIADILQEILNEGADWTALFENFEFHYHAQSFFQVFRKRVFSSPAFKIFWRKYKPLSSRKYSIFKGEAGLTSALKKAAFQPHTIYNSTKLRKAVFQKLGEDKESISLNFLIHLSGTESYFEANQRYNNEEAGLSDNKNLSETPVEFIASEIARQVANLTERHNPTHRVGLLCNYLFGAPIKRDICYREYGETNQGVHSIADLISFASGFDRMELEAMERDVRSKGIPASMHGLRKMLFRAGRI